jgi:hypothetical protein
MNFFNLLAEKWDFQWVNTVELSVSMDGAREMLLFVYVFEIWMFQLAVRSLIIF